MAKKVRAGEQKFFYFILFFIFLTVYVCTYVYILGGHWDARHVRPLTFNTHIFCQFYSMQQHANSIIRVNGSRADGGEGPRGPCYLLQTVMNESQKQRPNSICMFTSSSSAASSSIPCALSDIAYTYKNLPQCCCSVHANNLSCIQRFRGACAFKAKKKTRMAWATGGWETPIPLIFRCSLIGDFIKFPFESLFCRTSGSATGLGKENYWNTANIAKGTIGHNSVCRVLSIMYSQTEMEDEGGPVYSLAELSLDW